MKITVEIERPCLWFARGQVVELTKFLKYYTPHAVQSLEEYGYIKINRNE